MSLLRGLLGNPLARYSPWRMFTGSLGYPTLFLGAVVLLLLRGLHILCFLLGWLSWLMRLRISSYGSTKLVAVWELFKNSWIESLWIEVLLPVLVSSPRASVAIYLALVITPQRGYFPPRSGYSILPWSRHREQPQRCSLLGHHTAARLLCSAFLLQYFGAWELCFIVFFLVSLLIRRLPPRYPTVFWHYGEVWELCCVVFFPDFQALCFLCCGSLCGSLGALILQILPND